MSPGAVRSRFDGVDATRTGEVSRAENPVRIVIADDHELVRDGLRMLLEAERGFEVIDEACDVEEAKESIRRLEPSVLVLDLNMPGTATLPEIPEIAKSSPRTAVIVLTMQDDPAFAREALRAGARGYVLKQAAGAELVRAVRAATAGGTYLAPALGAQLAAAPSSVFEILTRREVTVLQGLARGNTNAEVGDELGISRRTVETHRAHLQEKLGISGRAQLTAYARQNHLLD
jgi:two-component system response regulator NreC